MTSTGTRVAALLVAALVASSTPAAAAPTWRPHVHAAVAYLHQRAGAVTFAVRTPGRRYGYRVHARAPTVSVVKAMLLVAYLRHARHRRLGPGDLALLGPMVRWSSD